MKKLTLIALFLVATIMLFAQSQRLTLVEHFTQASCPYCPPGNTHIDEIIANNPDKVIVLRYQVWWPGYDPMYFHNTADVDNRVPYYGITGVPGTVYDGINLTEDYYGFLTNEVVESHYQTPAPFDINVEHSISPNNDSVYLSASFKASEAVSGDLTAQLVVVERHIAFETAPGSNGEKNFYNVMKKMFPSADGTAMPENMAVGDSVFLEFSWKLENVYNVNELAVIAFVQDEGNHVILQTGFSDKKQANYDFDRDLAILSASNLPPSVCGDEGTIAPTITFQNFGAVSATSIEFKYRVNDGEENSYTWTGGIRHTETREAELDEISFTPAETNTLYIYPASLNGLEDENHANDTVMIDIPNAVIVNKNVTFELMTDSRPYETFWKFFHVDDLVNPIARSSSYGADDANTLITETIELPQNGCYQFVIQDLNGFEEGAYYKLYDSNGTLIYEGGSFVRKETVPFKGSLELSDFELGENQAFNIFPNPANNNLTISLNKNLTDVQLKIFNALGQIMLEKENVRRNETIDVSALEEGIYIVKIIDLQKDHFKKFIINR